MENIKNLEQESIELFNSLTKEEQDKSIEIMNKIKREYDEFGFYYKDSTGYEERITYKGDKKEVHSIYSDGYEVYIEIR